jgi:hypothetical protein
LADAPEETVSTPRDEIVSVVSKRTGQEREQSRNANPHATQSSENVDRCRRAHEDATVSGQDDEAIRQSDPLSGRNERLEGPSSQRREPKLAFADFLPHNESDGPMAKPARPVIENVLARTRLPRGNPERVKREQMDDQHSSSQVRKGDE